MNDSDCVQLLQWAMPRLHLQWRGFRRVRRQVCKRIARRSTELGFTTLRQYRERLEQEVSEWAVLDQLCRVTISRFYRDRGLFDYLRDEVLPGIAVEAPHGSLGRLRCWSAGCASGEEPYTVALIWHFAGRLAAAGTLLDLIGTDVDSALLKRARRGCYPASCLRELPAEWVRRGFECSDNDYCLRSEIRRDVTFLQQDIRGEAPAGRFHVVLCRNLAFTYFDFETQQAVLARLRGKLFPAGVLVIGKHESLPVDQAFRRLDPRQSVYRNGE